MPISKLESLDVSAALKGAPVLEHKRIKYTMSRSEVEGTRLLLPKGMRGEYAPADNSITRSFRIQESFLPAEASRLGNADKHDDDTSTESIRFFATQTGQKKPPREQPANLKIRYVPYGTEGTILECAINIADTDGDLKMAEAEAEAEASRATEQLSQVTPKSSKRSKKKRDKEGKALADEALSASRATREAAIDEESPSKTSSHRKKHKDKSKEKV